MAKTSTQDRKKPGKSHAAIDSALRTLDAGAAGVKAITAAMQDGLRTEVALVELDAAAAAARLAAGAG